MGLFFVYSLKVALCLIAFYLVYKLLLSRDSWHAFNRALLLILMGVSLGVPWIKIVTHQPTVMSEGMIQIEELIMSAEVVGETERSGISWQQIVFVIYMMGVGFFLVREFVSLIQLYVMIRRGRVVERGEVKIVVTDEAIAPLSWFGYMLINDKDYNENPREIIIHETAHITLRHSWDVVLCNLLIVFQWYNPAAWLLKRELQEVHEFEADNRVLENGVDARQYQMLLIKKSVGERLFSMANNLNHNSLKRRIKMMKSSKSSRWLSLKAVVVLPVAALAVVAFAHPKVKSVTEEMVAESEGLLSVVTMHDAERDAAAIPARSEQKESASSQSPDDVVFTMVQQNPEFPGGDKEMMKFVSSNIKYPENAAKQKIEGSVIVQFVVSKDGSIRDVKVLKGVNAELDAEAKRVVLAMPKWQPGVQRGQAVNVKFVLPIKFSLKDLKTTTATIVTDTKDGYVVEEARAKVIKLDEGLGKSEKTETISVSLLNAALVYIDGVKSTAEDLKRLLPDKIKSIDVLKDKAAVEKFGDEGKNGVILVETK